MRRLLVLFLLSASALLGANPQVLLKTNQGDIVVELWPDVAPKAVQNFIVHAESGYYNGTIFHRVIKGFMIQGGDPTGTGRGGDSIWGGVFENEYKPNIVFDKPGLLAMANRGPNTNASQFFITVAPTPWLNGGYTIFGKVVKGFDVVQKINHVKTGSYDRPMEKQVIIEAKILDSKGETDEKDRGDHQAVPAR
ncbi:MAG: peptidylprolyl isomerase [Campylobacteraceae bacterium 4484_4]|nr:MAG: peptidylprolyl isomerase [Campylobacteraceae bacterium 4484_4]